MEGLKKVIKDPLLLAALIVASNFGAVTLSNRPTIDMQTIHRVDTQHEECMVNVPELNGDTPEWADYVVRESHYTNCHWKRSNELTLYMLR